MFKLFFLSVIGILLSLSIETYAEKFPKNKKCLWISEVIPEAIIKINDDKRFSFRAHLIFDKKIVAEIELREPNGYGSKTWGWVTKNEDKVFGKGGRLIPFFGDKPARGLKWDKSLFLNNPRKVIFVGMGSDLYYSGFRGQKRLITAAEGLWRLENNCMFPGYLFNNRHLGI